jgi:hypothetical protein
MGRLNKIYYCSLALAVLFALWGFSRWLQAQVYMPPAPVMVAANRYSFEKPVVTFPLSRYVRLQTGELFFGSKTVPQSLAAPQPVFSSKLLLYGVIKGANAKHDRAIVGLIADPGKQTWVVQPGSVVNGETVVKIEKKGIWVKNETGMGRVGLRGSEKEI